MKLRLMVENGALAGQQFELQQGWYLLGRGVDCSIRFAQQEAYMVSNRHAMILIQPHGIFIVDQQSTNGTYLNGQRTTQTQIHSGDVIELGWLGPKLRAKVETEQVASAPAHQYYQSSPVDNAQSPAMPSGNSSQWMRGTVGDLGLYHPDRDQGKTARSLGIGLTLLVAAVISLMVMGLTVLSLGPVTALLSGIVAFVPAMFYLTILLWLDRYDPEPAWLLAAAFAWGGLVAILISGIVNTIFGAVAGDHLAAIISAPIIEEGTKGLGVLMIALLFRREFDSVVDGIVYAGVVALGFATVENISYYGDSFNKEGFIGLTTTFFLRGVLSPFAHVLFTGMTGIGCGIARETHRKSLRMLMPIAGYLAAMILHATWNGIASISGRAFLLLYFLILVPLFHLFVGLAIWLARRESRILKTMLATEVGRGLITQEQLTIASSIFQRLKWLAAALGRKNLFTNRRKFLRTVTKLGLCHWHVSRAAAAQTQTQSFTQIPRFQAEVLRLRHEIGEAG